MLKRFCISLLIITLNLIGSYGEASSAQSLDEICQKLLKDVDDQSARYELSHYSSDPMLPSQQKLILFSIQDKLDQISALKKRIFYYQQKRNAINKVLIQRGLDKSALEEALDRIKAGPVRKDFSVDVLEDQSLPKSLAKLHDVVLVEELELSDQYAGLQRQYDYLRSLHNNGQKIIDDKNVKFATNPVSYNTNSALLTTSQLAINAIKSGQYEIYNPSVDTLKRQVSLLNRDLSDLQDQSKAKEMKIQNLIKNVVDHSLSLSESEQKIQNKNINLSALSQEILDLRSRIELGQKIIEQRDAQIQSMQDQYNGSKTDLSNVLSSKDEKLVELSGILQIYKAKLGDSTKINRQDSLHIATLKDKIHILQTELLRKNQVLKDAKENLLALENQLNTIHDEVRRSNLIQAGEYNFRDNLSGVQFKVKKIFSILNEEFKESAYQLPLQ